MVEVVGVLVSACMSLVEMQNPGLTGVLLFET